MFSENHRGEFSATPERSSMSSSPLKLSSGHLPDVIPATEKKSDPTRQCTLSVASVKEIPEVSHDKAHFWLNRYVNKQNCRIWIEANPQVYVETPLHPEKLTVWCALWAGGILLQKR
ncbi:hypothetical protein TNCV_3139271 [Trichonephila clavipes]|nr:hypothetical protein TNCV_3139271 [Trichonephila clavipes]